MKQISTLSKTLGKVFVIPSLLMIVLTIASCDKDRKLSIATPTPGISTKSAAMHETVKKILRGFVTAQAGGSSQQSFAGGGSGTFSNVTMTRTNYSNPQREVTTWSDPTTPTTSYSFSESEDGGGLGQLSYNGKDFDYNYVLSIKVTAADPNWGSTVVGNELRALVAIDGEMGDTDFIIKNLAIFLVVGTTTEGTFEWGDFDTGASTTFAIGELLDFSELLVPDLSNMADAKFYYTSGGHVNVTETSFEMVSDAKVKDIVTGVEYSIDGALMSE